MVGRDVELAHRVERLAPPGDGRRARRRGAPRPRRPRRGGDSRRRASTSRRARSSVSPAWPERPARARRGDHGHAALSSGRSASTTGGSRSRRPALGDRRRDRPRPGGPARHGRRVGSQHRRELGAEVVSAAPVSRGPLLSRATIREVARDLIERYGVATPGPQLRARDLSGGNLQKLVLGREFSGSPEVLIAASPTRGLDVGAIETVHAYLRQAAESGVAVLLISEDLDEIRRSPTGSWSSTKAS